MLQADTSDPKNAAPALTFAPVQGALRSTGDKASYSVQLLAGTSYDFFLSQALTGGGTLVGASLKLQLQGPTLEAVSSTPAATVGNLSARTDPHIAFVAPHTGTYELVISSETNTTGTFTLSESVTDPATLVEATLQRSVVGQENRYWHQSAAGPLVLSYAFPQSISKPVGTVLPSDFTAFDAAQQDAVREALAVYASFVNVRFIETNVADNAQIRFGSTSSTRFGGTSNPGEAGFGSKRQETVLISSAAESGALASKMSPGQSGFETLLHEIGHALGLKHPGNYDGSNVGDAPFSPTAWDQREFTLLSYNGGGRGIGAVAPGILDILALQSIYGAIAQKNSTTFSVSATRATITTAPISGDTIDASNIAFPSIISLVPGTHSSIGPDAAKPAISADDNVAVPWGSSYTIGIGGAGNDLIFGNALSNSLKGNAGNDRLYGGAGTDLAIFSGSRAAYTVKVTSATTVTISDSNEQRDGTDVLDGIERLKFSDGYIALDIDGAGGQAYRLYQAAFNRTPDQGGLGYQINALDSGLALKQVASNFLASPEFTKTYGGLSNTQFVSQLYLNVLHRAADASGLSFQTNALATGTERAQLLVNFSESPENQAALIGVISAGMTYL